MRCFFCTEKSEHFFENTQVCEPCHKTRGTYLWPSKNCLRCGSLTCLGCDKLPGIEHVFSLYAYKGWLSLLLRLAKESNHAQGIQIFSEIFYPELKTFLRNIFSEKHYDVVFLSPISKERLTQNQWHPYFLFERIIEDLQKEFKNFHIVSTGKIKKNKKQAHLNLQERTAQSNKNTSQEITWFLNQKPLHTQHDKDVLHLAQDWLLVDDVLTTGTTIEKVHLTIKQDFSSAKVDIATLFRTPLD